MKKEFKIVEGKYKKEDEVVIEVVTEEVVKTSSVFNVGDLRKKIATIDNQVALMLAEKAELENLLDSSKDIAVSAVKEPEIEVVSKIKENE